MRVHHNYRIVFSNSYARIVKTDEPMDGVEVFSRWSVAKQALLLRLRTMRDTYNEHIVYVKQLTQDDIK